MSRMVPPFFNDEITSDGEKKLFKAFEGLSNDYAVLHSLGLKSHRSKVFSEIDFVVICEQGFLCLEVKGGLVQREKGVWIYKNRYGQENRNTEGPYKQVISAMHSLKDYLGSEFKRESSLSDCLFACGVVFPDMKFSQRGPDIVQEITFDSQNRIEELEEFIKNCFSYWGDLLFKKHRMGFKKLKGSEINRAINYFRGDFGFIPSLGQIVEQTEEQLLVLTKEQVQRLEIAGENPRILLKGGAGTGKTLLSLEYAKRKALAGERVLLLCYNKNLSFYLKEILEKEKVCFGELEVNTFHGFLLDKLRGWGNELPVDKKNQEKFFSEELPELFLKAIRERELKTYDTLVIDEGQDLLRFEFLMCMDSLLKGGMKEGKWHICYDPNQNIYTPNKFEGIKYFEEYNPVYLTLDTNCRNTRPIGIYNTLLTGLPPTKYFRVNGDDVERISYTDQKDQRRQVKQTVKRLIGQGIRPGSIVLLSRYKYENSCLEGKNIFGGFCGLKNVSVWSAKGLSQNDLRFCTIHSFKGLEAPVVIMLDVEDFEEIDSRMLNYTAMSRAKSLLFIFYRKEADQEIKSMVGENANLLKEIKD